MSDLVRNTEDRLSHDAAHFHSSVTMVHSDGFQNNIL